MNYPSRTSCWTRSRRNVAVVRCAFAVNELPLPETKQLWFTGRGAMGLSPV